MGIIRNPDDTVYSTITTPRWQKEWIQKQNAVNFSGLIQEVLIEFIRQHDPEYYGLHRHLIKDLQNGRTDFTKNLIKKYPGMVPLNSNT